MHGPRSKFVIEYKRLCKMVCSVNRVNEKTFGDFSQKKIQFFHLDLQGAYSSSYVPHFKT